MTIVVPRPFRVARGKHLEVIVILLSSLSGQCSLIRAGEVLLGGGTGVCT